VRSLGRGGGPEPEGTVYVNPPDTGLACSGNDLTGRVERAGIDVACLEAEERRAVHWWEGVGAHSALIVYGYADDTLASETEEAQRLEETDVDFAAYDDGDRWGTEESLCLHVPADVAEEGMAGRGEGREVRRRRARHEADARLRRQAEYIEQPARGDLFEFRCARCERPRPRVLVPRPG